MKKRPIHVITLGLAQAKKDSLKNELMRFAQDQFTALMKKNLKIPVSLYHL